MEIAAAGEAYAVRVLSVLPMLQAKIANLVTLPQKDRNDFLMLLVTREYLAMMTQAVEAGEVLSRHVINRLEQALRITTSSTAATCITKCDVDFTEVWPRDLLMKSTDKQLQNFARYRLPLQA